MRDLSLVLAYLAMWPFAWILPSAYWPKLTSLMAKGTRIFRRQANVRLIRSISAATGGEWASPVAEKITDDVFAGRIEDLFDPG